LGVAYNGLTEVLNYFGRLQQSGAAFKFEVHALLADDEHPVALLASTAERLRKANRAEGRPRLSRQRRWQGHRLVELLGGPASPR
jgi:hypothetical protein